MASYQEFTRKSRRRKMRRRALAGAVMLGAVCVIAVSGWLVLTGTGLIGGKAPSRPESTATVSSAAASQSTAASVAEPTAAPTAVPVSSGNGFALTPVTADTNWDTVAHTERTLNYTVLPQDDGTTAMDYRLAALPACGRVDTGYYDHVTFMGDSLTQGLELYSTGLPNAFYCAYKGIGPNAVVNGATCTRTNGQKEIPLEALAQMAPDAIYVLFGTNTLVNASDSVQMSFLAYYEQMIDLIQQTRPGIQVYVQSITPVRPGVQAQKPGLNNTRLQRINDELAAIALRKNCYFVDLWEMLADAEGNLRADYAAGDGIHLNPTGYAAWVEYLRTHTAYTPGALYELGSGSYYIEA